MAEKSKRNTDESKGLVSHYIGLSTGVAETAIDTCFGVVGDARKEAQSRVVNLIDLVESSQQGSIKLARSVSDRVDKLSQELVDSSENAIKSFLHTARDAGYGAAKLAAKSAASLTSKNTSTTQAA